MYSQAYVKDRLSRRAVLSVAPCDQGFTEKLRIKAPLGSMEDPIIILHRRDRKGFRPRVRHRQVNVELEETKCIV